MQFAEIIALHPDIHNSYAYNFCRNFCRMICRTQELFGADYVKLPQLQTRIM